MLERLLDSLGEALPVGEPYGPGKFGTDVDAWIYCRSLHGGLSEEVAEVGGGNGWYGLVVLDDEERAHLDTLPQHHGFEAAILWERSDGIVETTWYDSAAAAREAFQRIEAEMEEVN